MRCYEYIECNQLECPMYGKSEGSQCWEVDKTLCFLHVIKEVRQELSGMEKKESCKLCGCPYYKAANPKQNSNE